MSWTHLSESTPTARKPHRCYLCGQVIAAGERYIRRNGINDGRLTSTPMHPECERETRTWEMEDWECFWEGGMERPAQASREGGAE